MGKHHKNSTKTKAKKKHGKTFHPNSKYMHDYSKTRGALFIAAGGGMALGGAAILWVPLFGLIFGVPLVAIGGGAVAYGSVEVHRKRKEMKWRKTHVYQNQMQPVQPLLDQEQHYPMTAPELPPRPVQTAVPQTTMYEQYPQTPMYSQTQVYGQYPAQTPTPTPFTYPVAQTPTGPYAGESSAAPSSSTPPPLPARPVSLTSSPSTKEPKTSTHLAQPQVESPPSHIVSHEATSGPSTAQPQSSPTQTPTSPKTPTSGQPGTENTTPAKAQSLPRRPPTPRRLVPPTTKQTDMKKRPSVLQSKNKFENL